MKSDPFMITDRDILFARILKNLPRLTTIDLRGVDDAVRELADASTANAVKRVRNAPHWKRAIRVLEQRRPSLRLVRA